MDRYQNLANAVVVQAAEDYLQCRRRLKRLKSTDFSDIDEQKQENYEKQLVKVQGELNQLVDFFHSDWYRCLTTADPDLILEKLDTEAV